LAPDDMMIVSDLSVALMASGNENEARDLLDTTGQYHAFHEIPNIPYKKKL
jgi:hypothetical protein